MDVLGPYEKSKFGNYYVLIAVDLFSKWVELQPTPVATTNRVVAFLEKEIFARWGAPEVVITDNGAQFLGERYERLMELNHVKCMYSPVYHQQANPVERRVQEFKKLLRASLINKSNREWEEQLHTVLYCLRNRQNSAIRQTPAELLLGYTPPRPGAWVLPAYERPAVEPREDRIERAKQRQIVFERNLFPDADRIKITFQPGDLVMTRNFSKGPFDPAWIGPFPVIRKEGETVFSVDRNGSEQRVHINDIRPAPPERHPPRRRPEPESDNNEPDQAPADRVAENIT